MKGFYYVYILLCKDKTYYTGVTNNIERRLLEHNSGMSEDSYTQMRRPVELKYYQLFNSIEEAIRWEKKIKKWSQRKKEALIDKNYHLLPELSKKIKLE
jgi:putative endonuclease